MSGFHMDAEHLEALDIILSTGERSTLVEHIEFLVDAELAVAKDRENAAVAEERDVWLSGMHAARKYLPPSFTCNVEEISIAKLASLISEATTEEKRAAVAAAYERAAQECESKRQRILANPGDPSWTEHFAEVQRDIRALAPADAKAALSRALAQARLEEGNYKEMYERLFAHVQELGRRENERAARGEVREGEGKL